MLYITGYRYTACCIPKINCFDVVLHDMSIPNLIITCLAVSCFFNIVIIWLLTWFTNKVTNREQTTVGQFCHSPSCRLSFKSAKLGLLLVLLLEHLINTAFQSSVYSRVNQPIHYAGDSELGQGTSFVLASWVLFICMVFLLLLYVLSIRYGMLPQPSNYTVLNHKFNCINLLICL